MAEIEEMRKAEATWHKKCWCACSLICILLGILAIVQMFFVPNDSGVLTTYLHSEVVGRLVMSSHKSDENNKYFDFFEIWRNQRDEDAGVGLFHYFIFNITNPSEAAAGETPQIDQLGPFVYRRYETKTNLEWSEDDSKVSYTILYEYEFQPDLSTKEVSLQDYVYVVSGQMIVFLIQCDALGLWQSPPIREALEEWPGEYIFAYDTIETFLHGYVDTRLAALLGLANPVAFINNASVPVEEYTGYPDENLDRIRELIVYRGHEYQQWGGDAGDTVDWKEYYAGSRESGRQWRPEDTISKDDILYLFAPEKFRNVEYEFIEETEYNGLDLYRYRIMDKEWWTTQLHPNQTVNGRYGQDGPYDGVMRLDLIRNSQNNDRFQRLPVLLSKGLFLDAPEYQENITLKYGLNPPDPLFDDQYIDVEPVSGTAFRIQNTYMICLQVNPLLAPISSNFSNLSSELWIPQQYVSAEAFAQEKTVDFFVDSLTLVNNLKTTSYVAGPILGVILFIIAAVIYYKKLKTNPGQNYALMMENNQRNNEDTTTAYGSMKGGNADNNGHNETAKESEVHV